MSYDDYDFGGYDYDYDPCDDIYAGTAGDDDDGMMMYDDRVEGEGEGDEEERRDDDYERYDGCE